MLQDLLPPTVLFALAVGSIRLAYTTYERRYAEAALREAVRRERWPGSRG